MKKIMFFVAATIVLAAVGCSKDNATGDGKLYVSELKINLEGDTRISTSHSNAGLKFAWEDGDAIEVWEDLNTTGGRKIFNYDATTQTFKPSSNNDRLEVGKKYFAVTTSETYTISVEDGKSVVPISLGNGIGFDKYPMITNVFEATTENTMATMHHIVGVVEIPVKAAVSGVQLQLLGLNSQTANLAIRGIFNVSPEAPYTLNDIYGYFDTYNQTKNETPIDLSTTKATSIFIPAYPGTYSTIDVKYTLVGGSEKTINTNHSLTVERGKITKISEFVLE